MFSIKRNHFISTHIRAKERKESIDVIICDYTLQKINGKYERYHGNNIHDSK